MNINTLIIDCNHKDFAFRFDSHSGIAYMACIFCQYWSELPKTWLFTSEPIMAPNHRRIAQW